MTKNTRSTRKFVARQRSVNEGITQRSSNRIQKRTSRYGSRLSAVNGDAFFEALSNSVPETSNSIIQITSESSSSNQTNESSNTNDLSSDTTPISAVPTAESTPSNSKSPTIVTNLSSSIHSISIASRNTFEETVLHKLNEILVRLSELEKNTAKTDVRLRNVANELVAIRQNPRAATKIGTVDPAELARRGLPISSLEALNSFEQNLKDEAFVNDIVSLIMSASNFIQIS